MQIEVCCKCKIYTRFQRLNVEIYTYKIVQQFLHWLYIEMLIFWLIGHIGLTKIILLFSLFSPAYFLNVATGKILILQQRK